MITVIPSELIAGLRITNRAVIDGTEPESDDTNNEDEASVLILVPVPILNGWGLALLIIGLALAAVIHRRKKTGVSC